MAPRCARRFEVDDSPLVPKALLSPLPLTQRSLYLSQWLGKNGISHVLHHLAEAGLRDVNELKNLGLTQGLEGLLSKAPGLTGAF